MKNLVILICILSFASCYSPTPVPIQQVPVVSQPVVQEQVPNYEIRTDMSGNQVVYYTDPYSSTSYFIDMVLWQSLISRPGGYYNVHNYYIGNPSYFRNSYTRYNRSYTRSTYRSSSDRGARFRSSIPNNPSQSTSTYPGTSVPTGRTNSSSPTRSSIPSGSSRSSYTPSRSSSSSRSSIPSGRRH